MIEIKWNISICLETYYDIFRKLTNPRNRSSAKLIPQPHPFPDQPSLVFCLQPSTMSFGFDITDVLPLVQLALATFDGAKRPGGEHDEPTPEMSSLVTILDPL